MSKVKVETTQVRIEYVLQVTKSPKDLDDLTEDLIQDAKKHLDPELDEGILVCVQTPMDEVNKEESERLQQKLEEGYTGARS